MSVIFWIAEMKNRPMCFGSGGNPTVLTFIIRFVRFIRTNVLLRIERWRSRFGTISFPNFD